MKRFFLLIIISISLLTSSCIDEFLNREPLDVISEDDVWVSANAIQAYMAKMYDDVLVEDLSYDWIQTEAGYLTHYTDESMRSYSWGAPYTPTFSDEFIPRWIESYANIRIINEFLDKIPTANIDEKLIEQYIAEAHFLRAFNYFVLAKRYGGVPIIKVTQQYDSNNIEDLKVPRSTEAETWDFISEELDIAIANLPESHDASNQFRATKYSAYALKSRAMLYAGSISKYGNVQLNGLVGIPSEMADDYYKASLSASEAIIQSGKFALYKKYEDKAKNFQQLFLDETLHEEAIYVKSYAVPDKAHSFDFYNAAPSFRIDYGTNINPTLELVEEFEYIDGRKGTLIVNDASGNPIYYDNADDIFKEKDPRFFATILYPNCPWQGNVIEIRRGIIDSNGVKVVASSFADKFTEDESYTVSGKDGLVLQGDCSRTGFYIKKFMDPDNRLDFFRSEQNYLVFRYAETLLNYAEAAMELGLSDKALPKLNEVRERAGIVEKNTISIDDIRHERIVEFAFENQRYWDLVRWRIATKVMNNTQFSALIPWLDFKTKKYVFEKGPNTLNLSKTFLEKNYYQPIPGINQNELLIQNPGF
jgi:hypothetical protein